MRILGATALISGVVALVFFLAGDTPDAGAAGTLESPRVAMVEADGSSAILEARKAEYRASLRAHARRVEDALAPLARESNGASQPTEQTAARAAEALSRAHRDLPVPDRTNRTDTELHNAYLAALKALHWGAEDIAGAAARDDASRLARGQRWLQDGLARLREVQRWIQ